MIKKASKLFILFIALTLTLVSGCSKSSSSSDSPPSLPIKSIQFKQTTYYIYVLNNTLTANYQVSPTDSIGVLEWSVTPNSTPNIVTVNNSGILTSFQYGTVTVNVALKSNPLINDSSIVMIVSTPSSLRLSEQTINLSYYLETKALDATLNPGATGNILWSSSDDTVFTIDQDGIVTARQTGTASIQAQVQNTSVSANGTVVVNIPVTQINTNTNSVTLTDFTTSTPVIPSLNTGSIGTII